MLINTLSWPHFGSNEIDVGKRDLRIVAGVGVGVGRVGSEETSERIKTPRTSTLPASFPIGSEPQRGKTFPISNIETK